MPKVDDIRDQLRKLMEELMPIKKMHIGLCDCHQRVIRNDDENRLKEILTHNIVCDLCGTSVKYKGYFEIDAENIVDDNFMEEKIDVVKKNVIRNKGVAGSGGKRNPANKQEAIDKKLIMENGMPYYVEGKKPSYGSLIFSIRFAIVDENLILLNDIFYQYNDIIISNVAKYITKKEKAFLKERMNIEL